MDKRTTAARTPNALPMPRAPDHWHIDLDSDWEMIFWTRQFLCSHDELRDAVRLAGNTAGDVRTYLRIE